MKRGRPNKLFLLWMFLGFAWWFFVSMQMRPYGIGPDRLWGDPVPVTVGQECAGQQGESLKTCELIRKIVGAPLIFGSARFTSWELIGLTVVPPFWILALGYIVILIIRRINRATLN